MEILEPEVLSPLQKLAERALTVKFEGKLTANDINDDFKERANIALQSLANPLETDDDFDKAKADIKACKETEKKLKSALEDITSGSKEISEVKDVVSGYIRSFAKQRIDLNTAVTTRDKAKKKAITDAGRNEIQRVLALTSVSRIFSSDFSLIDLAIKGRKKYRLMEDAVNAVVLQEITRLAWFERQYDNNKQLLAESVARVPSLKYHDSNALLVEGTDKLKLIIMARESEQELALKKEADRLAAKAEADRKAKEAKKKADDEAARKAEEARKAKEEADRQAKIKADQEAEEQRKLAEAIPEPVKTNYPPLTAERAKVGTPPQPEPSAIKPPAENKSFVAPPTFTPPPSFEPKPEPETKSVTVLVTIKEDRKGEILGRILALDGVLSAEGGGSFW